MVDDDALVIIRNKKSPRSDILYIFPPTSWEWVSEKKNVAYRRSLKPRFLTLIFFIFFFFWLSCLASMYVLALPELISIIIMRVMILPGEAGVDHKNHMYYRFQGIRYHIFSRHLDAFPEDLGCVCLMPAGRPRVWGSGFWLIVYG